MFRSRTATGAVKKVTVPEPFHTTVAALPEQHPGGYVSHNWSCGYCNNPLGNHLIRQYACCPNCKAINTMN